MILHLVAQELLQSLSMVLQCLLHMPQLLSKLDACNLSLSTQRQTRHGAMVVNIATPCDALAMRCCVCREVMGLGCNSSAEAVLVAGPDGHVTALSLTNGSQLYRFQAAPSHLSALQVCPGDP